MAYFPAGGSTYTLQSSITSTQTTITLTSFTEPVSGTPYTMALLNTDIVYATIGPKTSSSEFISFTGITQNSDGTATLTGVTRGLAKKYPLTENSTFKLPHSGQTTFILSDAPQVFGLQYAALKNDNIFTGQNEVPAPLDDADIANKGYVDALVNGGTVSNNRIVVAGVAGETLTIGQHVYYKTSDSRWWKTDADDATITYGVQTGIAQGAGTAGNNVTNGILLEGVDTNNTGTSGVTAYIGNTAGALSETVGTNTRAVGKYLPALAGIYYNPNLFVKYPQNTQSVYAVDSVGTDSYAITLTPAPGSYTDGMTVTFKAGTANTGACTLNVNGLGAKSIKKGVSGDLSTGDILASQIVTVVYDGTNFQLVSLVSSVPVINTYTTAATALGSSTTQFDITNTAGSTYRYTYDTTGTDPNFSAANNPVGSLIYFNTSNFSAGNNGLFVVTGSGANYVEVTNASGVVESNKTLGSTGQCMRQTAANGIWTKPAGLSYVEVEQVGGGGSGEGVTSGGSTSDAGGGGGAGGYARKVIPASSLSSTVNYIVAPTVSTSGVANGNTGYTSIFGTFLTCNGGTGGASMAGGSGGTATGGDLNVTGGDGDPETNNSGSIRLKAGGSGGASYFGGGGKGGAPGSNNGGNGSAYGSGGGGGSADNGGSGNGGSGAQGIIIVREYYS